MSRTALGETIKWDISTTDGLLDASELGLQPGDSKAEADERAPVSKEFDEEGGKGTVGVTYTSTATASTSTSTSLPQHDYATPSCPVVWQTLVFLGLVLA